MTTGSLTIQDNDQVVQYTATNGQTEFAFDFPILSSSELAVSQGDAGEQSRLVYGSDYTITGIGEDAGGFITLAVGAVAGQLVTLWLDMPIEPVTGFSPGANAILGQDLNAEIVRNIRTEQMLRREVRSSIRLRPDAWEQGADMQLPAGNRSGKFLAFDSQGHPILADGTGSSGGITAYASLISPVEYGAPTNGTSPAATYIQQVIDAIASGARSGILWIDRTYSLESTLVVPAGLGMILFQPGADLQSSPAVFAGGRLRPHGLMSEDSPLLQVGELGSVATNPHGLVIQNGTFDGRTPDGSYHPGCIGVDVQDTRSVRIVAGAFYGFDPAGDGIGLNVLGASSATATGTRLSDSRFVLCNQGVVYAGDGAVDQQHSGNLFLQCYAAVTAGLGGTGGAALSIRGDFFSAPGLTAGGYYLRTGPNAVQLSVSQATFDAHGQVVPVRLGNARALVQSCTFSCAADQDAVTLIEIEGAVTQEAQILGNTLNRNGSEIASFVKYADISGTPTQGIVADNVAIGASSAWVGFVIDGANALVLTNFSGPFYNYANSEPGVSNPLLETKEFVVSIPYAAEAEEIIFQYRCTRPLALPSDFAAWQGWAPTADVATAETVWTLYHDDGAGNQTEIGTITWGPGGEVPVFAPASDPPPQYEFAVGEIFVVMGPDAPDGTLKNTTLSMVFNLGGQ